MLRHSSSLHTDCLVIHLILNCLTEDHLASTTWMPGSSLPLLSISNTRDCITPGLKGQEEELGTSSSSSLSRSAERDIARPQPTASFPTLTPSRSAQSLGTSGESVRQKQKKPDGQGGGCCGSPGGEIVKHRQWARRPAPLFQNSGSCDSACSCSSVHFSAPSVPVYAAKDSLHGLSLKMLFCILTKTTS